MSCGPGWLGKTKLLDTPLGFSFTACCDEHDELYGNPEGRTRRECDLKLYTCLLAVADEYRGGLHTMCSYFAWRYYWWVRVGGWIAWRRCRRAEK